MMIKTFPKMNTGFNDYIDYKQLIQVFLIYFQLFICKLVNLHRTFILLVVKSSFRYINQLVYFKRDTELTIYIMRLLLIEKHWNISTRETFVNQIEIINKLTKSYKTIHLNCVS